MDKVRSLPRTAMWAKQWPQLRHFSAYKRLQPRARFAAMNLSRRHRRLLTWMLYSCILLNVFACSLAHGQMAGLALSGLDSGFCLGADGDLSNPDTLDSTQSVSFSCPLCGSIVISLALLFSLSWLILSGRQPFFPAPPKRRLPPRFSWPSANPRASPLDSVLI